jgi:N-acetylglucosaminyl-diphospho-decaprenol L-rhamnosyltransferase
MRPLGETLAIVIVSFNGRRDLEVCLGALPEALGDVEATTVVVDNGSTDGTTAWLGQDRPDVRLIETGSNLGFAKANNVGIRATSGDLVLLLNPDTIPMPGSLARLVATLRAHPEAAAVGPRLIDAAGHPELSFGRSMSPFGELRQKTIEGLARRGVGPVERWLARALQTPGTRGWISGACLLARRADLDAVGLFDERYFMYAEDVDLCLAFARRGRTVRFDPDALVKHLRGQSAHANPRLEQLRRESQMAYYRKHHPAWAPLLRWYLQVRRAGP